MSRLLLALLLMTLIAACGPEDVADGPVDPGEPGSEGETLEGALGGDAQLEGGCAWLESDGQTFEVIWPDGYHVEFAPLQLVGPDGEVIAGEGDTVRVSGREATEMASICMIGPMFAADAVLTP